METRAVRGNPESCGRAAGSWGGGLPRQGGASGRPGSCLLQEMWGVVCVGQPVLSGLRGAGREGGLEWGGVGQWGRCSGLPSGHRAGVWGWGVTATADSRISVGRGPGLRVVGPESCLHICSPGATRGPTWRECLEPPDDPASCPLPRQEEGWGLGLVSSRDVEGRARGSAFRKPYWFGCDQSSPSVQGWGGRGAEPGCWPRGQGLPPSLCSAPWAPPLASPHPHPRDGEGKAGVRAASRLGAQALATPR